MHFTGPRKSDFIEMGLHHMSTIYLLFGSYMMNNWEVGVVIAYLHDFTDVLGHLTKLMVNLDVDKYSLPLFLILIV